VTQVLDCNDLAAADLGGTSDPYVAVRWREHFVGCTRIKVPQPRLQSMPEYSRQDQLGGGKDCATASKQTEECGSDWTSD
jgi:hypothetical protein